MSVAGLAIEGLAGCTASRNALMSHMVVLDSFCRPVWFLACRWREGLVASSITGFGHEKSLERRVPFQAFELCVVRSRLNW